MSYLIGLDIGTTGAKVVLSDERGQVLATATSEYPLSTPSPLWSEQNPSDWWHGAQEALRAVVTGAGADADQIAGLGLTGQMHGAVFLDKHGEVIRPALLWNDQRTVAECQEITDRVGPSRLIEITGNPALTGFQAPKVLWLRNHELANYDRVAQLLLPKDYIRLLLTGVSATDASDAAGTLLLDLHSRDWSDEVLDRCEIPRAWLPRVFEGPEVAGELLSAVAASLGLPKGLPVVAGGGDNAAAAIGTGIVRPGVISSSIGTSGVLFAHSDTIALDQKGRLHTFCHTVPGRYHLMAVTLSAGGSFRWLRDVFREINAGASRPTYEEMGALAANAPPGAEGLIFLPYLNGERTPHLDPLARGAFVGLTTRHREPHFVRAVMEGVVFALRDGLDVMRELGLSFSQILATGGGSRSALWRQMQADIYGMQVARLSAEEGPAFGAALLAGVGAGLFRDVHAAVEQCVEVADVTHPNPATQERYQEIYGVYKGLYRSLRESMHTLAGIATNRR